MILNQLGVLASQGVSNVHEMRDNTDESVLLLHLYNEQKLTCNVMASFVSGRSVVDIKATTFTHRDTVQYLPAMLALTDCDTTAFIYGIGKATALKLLQSDKSLSLPGVDECTVDDVVEQATAFMAGCYG